MRLPRRSKGMYMYMGDPAIALQKSVFNASIVERPRQGHVEAMCSNIVNVVVRILPLLLCRSKAISDNNYTSESISLAPSLLPKTTPRFSPPAHDCTHR